ncbi:MAG: homoserine kinase [Chloroflexi bacterium]|nr:homoserine kinase [Chloroflexota bacterium]
MMANYTKLQKNDIQAIAENYALTIADVESIQGGASNSNYLMHTRQGDHVLTMFEEKTLPEATQMGRLLLSLAEYEFPTVRLVPTREGSIATMYMDKPVIVKPYIVGQVYPELTKSMLQQIGAAMARLHQISVPDFLTDQQPYGIRHLEYVIGKNVDPEYENWAATRLAWLGQRVPSELPRGLIHGDVFCDNVLFVGDELRAIIDFEEVICYYKGYDLGMAIIGLCGEESTITLDKARALVHGYQQVRILEKREKETLQLLTEYAATAVSCWRFWKYYIYAVITENADKHQQMMRLAKEIGDIPRARFLDAVFG